MRHPVFMIGIDVIFELEKISVLEMQTFIQCYQSLEWKKALNNFQKIIEVKFPKRGLLSSREDEVQQMLFRSASVSEYGIDVLNVGIASIAYFKWIFYAFCQLHSELKPYIPQTHVLTLATLGAIPIEQLRATPLFKPIHLTLGKGVKLIEELNDSDKLFNALGNCQINPPQPKFLAHFPFLMQEFLGFNKQVTRVFALVIVNPDTGLVEVAIDQKNSYGSRLIVENNNFESEKNKEYFPRLLTHPEKNQLGKFIQLFFKRLLNTYALTHFRYWEILAKKYIDNCDHLPPATRLWLISHFAWAAVQEQRFTENKLSLYQCFILEGFLKCYIARGDSTRFKLIEPVLANAMRMIIAYNITPYMHEKYRANEVLKVFMKVSGLEDQDTKVIQPLIRPQTHLNGLLEIRPHKKVPQMIYHCIFSFLHSKDINQIALLDKDHLNYVAGSCRIF